ncbi:protein UXT isoform X2 [Poecile atricapillus]|uniref:protein UXT isoform X2 n=1 Tax=Poecile atricapillus TaxID=48891 RepID=UPI00273833C0|nr:protein UXT isoform X2 [Poecile atricapillus]
MAAAEKTQRYEAFISDVLQRDLRRVQEQREAVHEQQAQVLQLQAALARLQDVAAPLHTQVDLGCNFFVSAEVPDPQRVFVALGFGFFAELTLPEALRHLERRSSFLQRACGSCRGCRAPPPPRSHEGPLGWPRPHPGVELEDFTPWSNLSCKDGDFTHWSNLCVKLE